jgi:hypothetical protein
MRPRSNPLNPKQLPETIEQRPIGDLLPCAANARTHSEEQVDQLVKSIRRFGWTNPVLVGADGVIIAGHARVLAARRLKLDRVPVIVLGHLSDGRKQEPMMTHTITRAQWIKTSLRIPCAVQKERVKQNGCGVFRPTSLRSLDRGRRRIPNWTRRLHR